MRTKTKAVFLDRDGVLNEAVYRGENCVVAGKKVEWTAPWSMDEFRPCPGVVESLAELGKLGFLRILITNQPDVAYGCMSQGENDRIMREARKLPLDDIFICYHTRYDGCDCKKPKPGMFMEAAEKHDIDLGESWSIGDRAADLIPSQALGCKTVLIQGPQGNGVEADFYVNNLTEAIRVIKEHI